MLGCPRPVLTYLAHLGFFILYLGTFSSRIALASILVTCMNDMGKRSPCSRHCHLWNTGVIEPLEPPSVTSRQSPAPLCQRVSRVHDATFCVYLEVLRSVWRFSAGTQVRGSTVKDDHLAIMGNIMLPWSFPSSAKIASTEESLRMSGLFAPSLVRLSSTVESCTFRGLTSTAPQMA